MSGLKVSISTFLLFSVVDVDSVVDVIAVFPKFKVLPSSTAQRMNGDRKIVLIFLRLIARYRRRLALNTQPTCGLALKVKTIEQTKISMLGNVILF